MVVVVVVVVVSVLLGWLKHVVLFFNCSLPLPPPFLCYPNEASETSFLPEMCGHG